VRSAAASARAGDARPARARCGTAMCAGTAVRAYGTAVGRPLDHRVNDRERTSRPDGKARRDPARAAGSAGTGRAAGGAVPVLVSLAAPRTRLIVGRGAARVPPNQGVQPTPLARPVTCGESNRQARGRLFHSGSSARGEAQFSSRPRFTGTRRRLARCLCLFLPKLASVTTRRRGATDAQMFGGTSPSSSGRARPAAASRASGDARPARARCRTAMHTGVAVRSCGTAVGRPLGRRVDDRERTSRPDGKGLPRPRAGGRQSGHGPGGGRRRAGVR
jgi:hypothetical protein